MILILSSNHFYRKKETNDVNIKQRQLYNASKKKLYKLAMNQGVLRTVKKGILLC